MKPRSSPYRILLWVGLILIGFMLYRGVDQGAIKRPFDPTPTPTRTIYSFEQEGDTFFQIGNLDSAIQAYQDAAKINPDDVDLWTKLARIQTYSSASITTDQDILQRMQDALASIDKAVALQPENSDAHAVRAFVLDWLASSNLLTADQKKNYLNEAEAEATRAQTLDEQNVQALAFKAEILVDQQKWLQAQQTIDQALQRAPDNMDVHRINAYVLSSLREYRAAIDEYKRASELAPNLTYLYVEIGKIYRYLATSGDPLQADENFQTALDYFTQAVNINKQLGIGNPIPYLARGKVYTQRGYVGDFFLAIQEVEKALQLNPGSADVFAQLGLTYHQARNYEGAIEALRCALDGCTPEQSCIVRQDCDDPTRLYAIQPLALTDTTVVYFYTYGSVLAALSKPTNTFCTDAARIFSQLRGKYGQDDFVMSFVLAGETICSNEPSPVPTATSLGKTTPTTVTRQTTPTP